MRMWGLAAVVRGGVNTLVRLNSNSLLKFGGAMPLHLEGGGGGGGTALPCGLHSHIGCRRRERKRWELDDSRMKRGGDNVEGRGKKGQCFPCHPCGLGIQLSSVCVYVCVCVCMCVCVWLSEIKTQQEWPFVSSQH